MSASVILMFEKGEIKKIKEWFSTVCPIDRYPDLPIPESEFRPKEYTRGIYVEFKANHMELDRAIWDNIAGCYATFIGQELARKFKLEKAGWDSVGYCTKDFLKSSGLLSWKYKELAEKHKQDESKSKYFSYEFRWREKAERFFRKKAIELIYTNGESGVRK